MESILKIKDDTFPQFLVICGPTASGKTSAAIEIAKAINGEIVCCDSVQIYKGFDIGSAKPTVEEQQSVPHHLFDVFAWNENCDAAIYAEKAKKLIASIRSRGRMPIVVGGTGLYLRALLGDTWDDDIPSDAGLRKQLETRSHLQLYEELQRLDPRRASELHVNDKFRVVRALEINLLSGKPVQPPRQNQSKQRLHYLIKLEPPRDMLTDRIIARTATILHQGLIDEVRKLLSQGVSENCKPMTSIGYKESTAFLRGEIDFEQLQNLIVTATRQYAKRQMTWFKKVEADAILSNLDSLPKLIDSLKDLI